MPMTNLADREIFRCAAPAAGGVWVKERLTTTQETAMIISYIAEGLAKQLSDSHALHARQRGARGVPEERAHHHFPRAAARRSHVPVTHS